VKTIMGLRITMWVSVVVLQGFSCNAESVVRPSDIATQPVSLDACRNTLENYIAQFQNRETGLTLTTVSRLPGGRVQEVEYRGTWKANQEFHRLSFYAQGRVEGRKQWYNIEDVLIGNDSVLVWRHPGFPGSIEVGAVAERAGSRLLRQSQTIADPRHAFLRIRRVLNHASAKLQVQQNGDAIVTLMTRDIAKTAPPGRVKRQPTIDDHLEIVLSQQHGFLPTSMRRAGIAQDADNRYQSGAGYTIDYTTMANGERVPKRIVEDKRLNDEFTGDVYREWVFNGFAVSGSDADDSGVLLLPKGAVVVDVDCRERFTLGEGAQEETAELQTLFSDRLRIVGPRKAMNAILGTAAGQSPDLPPIYESLKKTSAVIVPRKGGAVCFLLGHLLLILAVFGLAYWQNCRSHAHRR
jgi:hypothetical protein